MAIDTKPNFSNKKFEQCSGDIMNLSGCTQIFGTFDIETGATLTICENAGVGKVLTSNATGLATWETASSEGITSLSGGSGMNFSPISTTGEIILGTPTAIINSSSNVSSGTTHNHAFSASTFVTGTQGILVDGNNRFYLDDVYIADAGLPDLTTVNNVTANQSLGILPSGQTLGMVYITNTGSTTAVVDLGTTPTGNDITSLQSITIAPDEDVSVTVNMRLSLTENTTIYINSDDWTNVGVNVQWAHISYDNVPLPSGLLYTFGDGLTESAGTVKLGGTYSSAIYLNSNTSNGYFGLGVNGVIDQYAEDIGNEAFSTIWQTMGASPSLKMDAGIFTTGARYDTNITMVKDEIQFHGVTNSVNNVTVHYNNCGLRYCCDVSSCNTNNPRWIPDKAYVDSLSGGTGGTPAGSNYEIQFNDNGTFGADTNFKWDGKRLTVSDGSNIFIGPNVNRCNGVGTNNTYVGSNIAFNAISAGCNNVAVGLGALFDILTGKRNVSLGQNSGGNLTTGCDNVFLGSVAGYNSTSVNGNVYLGNGAGYYENSSNNLYIDNQFRTDLATQRTNSLIYGCFNITPANQFIRLNSQLELPHLTGCTNSDVLYYNSTDGTVSYGTPSGGSSKKQITVTASSTPTPSGDAEENEYYMTAQNVSATFAAPTGTTANGNTLLIRIKNSGAGATTLAWNSVYRGIGLTLPNGTLSGKILYVTFIYNSQDSKWDGISMLQE